ncbi:MAG TPA: hypothetical protein ENO17_05545 [Candidatus Atribacteria bacterium]|nr:hypothetical protein [Candidatus Atribacteria bacterium]
MNKIYLKEKIEILNSPKFIFVIVLFILFIVLASILLLIWWPVKPSFAEITNSWISLIMVYLVLSVALFEKPIYKLFEEFIMAKKSRKQDSQQSKQEQFLGLVSDINISDFIPSYDFEGENIIKKENQNIDTVILKEEEMTKHIRKLHQENTKWRFLYADTYLVLYAKYVLFWFNKSKSVNREEYDNIWQSKISESKERQAILNALLDLEFIRREKGDDFSITDLGLAYINYLKEIDRSKDVSSGRFS